MCFTRMCTVVIVSLFTYISVCGTSISAVRYYTCFIRLHPILLNYNFITCTTWELKSFHIVQRLHRFGATFVWHTLQCCSAVITNICKLIYYDAQHNDINSYTCIVTDYDMLKLHCVYMLCLLDNFHQFLHLCWHTW